jgi:hypothetical protein
MAHLPDRRSRGVAIHLLIENIAHPVRQCSEIAAVYFPHYNTASRLPIGSASGP